METVAASVKSAEGVFSSLGLGDGAFAPLARGAFGWALGTSAVMALRGMGGASFAFDEQGARPFVLFEPDAPNPTYFPWWLPGICPAILFGMFV